MVSPLWNYPPGLSALTGWPDDAEREHREDCLDPEWDCTCSYAEADEQDAADSRREAREGR